jgi:hypothetical protein
VRTYGSGPRLTQRASTIATLVDTSALTRRYDACAVARQAAAPGQRILPTLPEESGVMANSRPSGVERSLGQPSECLKDASALLAGRGEPKHP